MHSGNEACVLLRPGHISLERRADTASDFTIDVRKLNGQQQVEDQVCEDIDRVDDTIELIQDTVFSQLKPLLHEELFS